MRQYGLGSPYLGHSYNTSSATTIYSLCVRQGDIITRLTLQDYRPADVRENIINANTTCTRLKYFCVNHGDQKVFLILSHRK